jgi:hypothetical protein
MPIALCHKAVWSTDAQGGAAGRIAVWAESTPAAPALSARCGAITDHPFRLARTLRGHAGGAAGLRPRPSAIVMHQAGPMRTDFAPQHCRSCGFSVQLFGSAKGSGSIEIGFSSPTSSVKLSSPVIHSPSISANPGFSVTRNSSPMADGQVVGQWICGQSSARKNTPSACNT